MKLFVFSHGIIIEGKFDADQVRYVFIRSGSDILNDMQNGVDYILENVQDIKKTKTYLEIETYESYPERRHIFSGDCFVALK